MKLLIITQSVDKKNTVLGFFHEWIAEFAKSFERITVICLEEGDHSLPNNVHVLSLGKEKGLSKIRYILNFYTYIWEEQHNYDAVFVHMNQEYILLGGLFWRMLGKKVTMWRNHHAGNILTDVACLLSNKIFSTSKYSYTTKFKKTVLMPVGIDTNLFKPSNNLKKTPNSILFLGRIAPVKNPHILIEALRILKSKGIVFNASIYGDSLSKDKEYHKELYHKVEEYGLKDLVRLYNGIPNAETVAIYNTHDIFVNLSSSGMYDKTIFEAMACGCLVLVSNDNLKKIIDDRFYTDKVDAESIAMKLADILNIKREESDAIKIGNRDMAKLQDITLLGEKIYNEIQ